MLETTIIQISVKKYTLITLKFFFFSYLPFDHHRRQHIPTCEMFWKINQNQDEIYQGSYIKLATLVFIFNTLLSTEV